MNSAPSTTASTTSMLATFTERAAPLDVTVERHQSSNAAAEAIVRLARETDAGRPVVASELVDAAPELIAAIETAGLRIVRAGTPAETRDVPLGLSLARLAVAETCSVLLAESTLDDRGVGLLVATQIVVCPTAALVASLDEAAPILREIAGHPGGAYATLVTGPSRTADIERVLTVGVQGPARLIVLLVDALR